MRSDVICEVTRLFGWFSCKNSSRGLPFMRTSSSRLFPFLFTFAWLFPLIKVLYIILILIWSFCLFFQISFFLFFSVSIGRSHIKTLGSVKCIFYVSLTSVFSCLLRTKGIDHLIEWTGSHSSILCLLVPSLRRRPASISVCRIEGRLNSSRPEELSN